MTARRMGAPLCQEAAARARRRPTAPRPGRSPSTSCSRTCRRDSSVLIWDNIFAANHVGHEAEIPRLRHRPPSTVCWRMTRRACPARERACGMFLADKSGTSTLPAIASCGTEWSSCCGRSHHGSCSCRSQLSQTPSLQGFGFRVRFDMPAFKGVSFPSSRVPSPGRPARGSCELLCRNGGRSSWTAHGGGSSPGSWCDPPVRP